MLGCSLVGVDLIRGGYLPSWEYSRPLTVTNSWEATDQMFGTPTNLGGLINSDRKESSPHISDDGLELWFASERYGGLGKRDIWFSRRASTNDQFGRPQHAGDEINSSADEESPTLTSGGRLLFFESTRSPRRGETTMETIWSSEWNSSAATNE